MEWCPTNPPLSVLWALGTLYSSPHCSALSPKNLFIPSLGPDAKERWEGETRVSGCGFGEEGGVELGTAEGERGTWRKITSELLQAQAEPSVSVGFSLSFSVFSRFSRLHDSVSICVCL